MREKMTRIVLAGILFLLQACGGRAGNPVAHYLPGDEKRDCESIKTEVASNEAELIRLVGEAEGTVTKNVLLGAAGIFLIVPWFFMDLKGGEETELEALQRRNKNLRQLGATKKCNLPEPKVKFESKEEAEEKEDAEENTEEP